MRMSKISKMSKVSKTLFTISVLMVLSIVPILAASDAPDNSKIPPSPNALVTVFTMDDAHQAQAKTLIANGIKFLLSKEIKGGGWSLMGPADPAITAMVMKAMLNDPTYNAKTPVIMRSVAIIKKFQQKNGGIYNPKIGRANYTTAICIMSLVALQDPANKKVIDDAVKYIKSIQIVPGSEDPEGKKIGEGHIFIGGTSYGKHGRPDLSNLGFSVEALKEAGVDAKDPFFKRAVAFASSCQAYGETNKRPWVKISAGQGGFIYAPAIATDLATPESKAGGVRSYGSMTYTGFKTLLYAGVDRDDKRVAAAFRWIQRYWSLETNPNMPRASSLEGIYYYYHVFAKALRAYNETFITDRKGNKHNWREELIDVLAKKVQADGSWVNKTGRWFEDDPVLCTCFSLLALGETANQTTVNAK